MTRRWLTATAGAVLPTVVAGLVGPSVTPTASAASSSAAAAVAAPAACAQALVVAVPGAGEGDAVASGTDAMGATLRPLAAGILAGAAARGRTVDTLTVVGDTSGPGALRARGGWGTPANRAITRASWRAWRQPVSSLTSRTRAVLASAGADCPDQLVYLIGYSQGAEAVHRVVTRRVDADLAGRTVGVVLVGDAARTAGTGARLVGDPRAPRAGRGVSAVKASAPLPDAPSRSWAAPVRQVCTEGDLVCDLSSTPYGRARSAHLSYRAGEMPDRLDGYGRGLGRRLSLWPVAPDQAYTLRGGLVASQPLVVDVAPSARADIRWKAVAGLPPGMVLRRNGYLAGTPTEAGTYDVTYTVRNASGPDVSRPMPGLVTVTVSPDLSSRTSTGGRHTCTVRSDGTLWCWGANFYGQLGTGDRAGSSVPVQVGTSTGWVTVAAGGMHTCGIRANGSLWCWGLNARGQLGLGNRKDKTKPVRVGTDKTWRDVSAGWTHTCAVREDDSAWCWGDDAYGQLGDGSTGFQSAPVPVSGGGDWSEVQAGGWHTCGVRASGAALCWGRNLDGELGDGSRLARRVPTPVSGGGSWATLQPAWTHTCGLRIDGTVACWGGNEGGQLGTGSRNSSTTPVALSGGGTWTLLSTGVGYTCGLDADRMLWCWGTGRYGELGTAGPTSLRPVRVGPDRAWATMDLGWLHGCVAAASGAPECWGNNETGELGIGSTAPASAPTKVGFAAPGGSATLTSRGLWEPALDAVVPGARPQAPLRARASATQVRFKVATFNVLGSNHTSPRADAREFGPARVRAEWSMDYLRRIDASIVGFQEFQRDQLGWFATGDGASWDVWPGTEIGSGGVQTSIAWRSDTWRLLATDYVNIPFITQTRKMALVQLQHRASGRTIWVMNIHNAPQGRQAQRTKAVNKEIRRLKQVVGTDPVLYIGDFNERARVYCQASRKLGMVAPRGGQPYDGSCHPPSGRLRVDWIFGTPDAAYDRYREDRRTLVQRITDHAVLRTRVTLR